MSEQKPTPRGVREARLIRYPEQGWRAFMFVSYTSEVEVIVTTTPKEQAMLEAYFSSESSRDLDDYERQVDNLDIQSAVAIKYRNNGV